MQTDAKSYRRLQIIGPSGSGKTTLAKAASAKLKIPHYELDAIFWLADWQEKPTNIFKREVLKITASDAWVVCGDYLDRLQGLTLERADAVVWLNFPPRIFLPRLIKRTTVRFLKKQRVFGVNKESYFNFWFRPQKSLLWITLQLYRSQGRKRQYRKVLKYNGTVPIVELKTRKEVRKWLESL